ncbi:MAG TPA: tetratricopeptide repeat protein [Pyrinomonadaceae bacterium]|jgi:Tfp pilus assembly protein PilF
MSALKKRVSRHTGVRRLSALAALLPALVSGFGAPAEARTVSNLLNLEARTSSNVEASRRAPLAFAALLPKLQGSDKSVRVAQLIEQGVSALERGDAASARESFEQAVKIEPTSETAHTFLGVIADRADNLREAERHFAAAAIAAPFSPAARNNHGAVLMRLGQFEKAAGQFEASLKIDKNQPSALVNLAQIRFQSGTPEALRTARELFERAHAIAPDAEIARALVIIALRQNERDSAARYFRDYSARLTRSASTITAPIARAELGAALLESGLAGEAAEEVQAALAAEPSRVEYLLLLARAHLARRDIPSAGRTLEGALARGLESAAIYAALAEVYELSGHIENAIPAMRLAIERDPKSEAYRFRYGMLLTDTKAPAAAVIRLQEALKEFPRSSRLWFALGVAQTALNKIGEAAEAFNRAQQLDPKFAPAFAYLGMTHDQQGRYQEAVAHYERALALDARLFAAHYLAAEALLKQTPADEERAERHLSAAVALDQKFAPARVSLAKLLLRRNRFEEAVAQLRSAVELDPNLAEAHYHLGRALTRLKRTGEAQVALDAFKRLSEQRREQSHTEPREIMRRLANVRF